MTDVTIYGPVMSTHVRTVRLTCAEKGVSHVVEEVDFRAESYRALHPFNRVPAMRHGDFVLFETQAMCRYIDRAFGGPSLQPADIKSLARMDQWMSAIGDYVYPIMLEELVWERLVVPMEGGAPDEAKIAAAMPTVVRQLAILENVLEGSAYLAGEQVSLADFQLFPILVYVRVTPEGEAALAKAPRVIAWMKRMAARPSASATDPTRG